jgi:DNA polymerase
MPYIIGIIMDSVIKLGPSGKRLCLNGEDLTLKLAPKEVQKLAREALTVGAIDRQMGKVEAKLREEIESVAALTYGKDFGENIVYMSGSPFTPLMFIGEAPGADEDYHAYPFVGLAGKKLTEMIEGGMQIPREAVVIANLLKRRPPDNRNPHPDEIDKSSVYLKRQIEIINPKVIVALGKFASCWILEKPYNTSITSLRGKVHELEGGVKVVATYHPSYLIRQYSIKNRIEVLKDVTLARNCLKELDLIPWW